MSGRWIRWSRSAFLAVLALLLVLNVLSLVRNQRTLPCRSRLCEKPRDLEQVATFVGGPKVASRKSVFHHLARRIPGAELTVPPWMAEQHRWELEHVARVRVAVSDGPMRIASARVDQLRGDRNITRTWLARDGSKEERQLRQLFMLVEEGAAAYVVAEEDRDGGTILVMPVERYREVVPP